MGKDVEEVRQSWIAMVDRSMYRVFISRQAQINAGIMTAEEADEIIIAVSKKYMDKYASMDDELIHKIMLKDLLGGLLDELEEITYEMETGGMEDD